MPQPQLASQRNPLVRRIASTLVEPHAPERGAACQRSDSIYHALLTSCLSRVKCLSRSLPSFDTMRRRAAAARSAERCGLTWQAGKGRGSGCSEVGLRA